MTTETTEQIRERAVKQYSTWEQGAKAAREGKPMTACPYSILSYDFVSWMYGWTFATHQMAKEDDEL